MYNITKQSTYQQQIRLYESLYQSPMSSASKL
jgi:hypothetical protein